MTTRSDTITLNEQVNRQFFHYFITVSTLLKQTTTQANAVHSLTPFYSHLRQSNSRVKDCTYVYITQATHYKNAEA